jgi:hypothetical protein
MDEAGIAIIDHRFDLDRCGARYQPHQLLARLHHAADRVHGQVLDIAIDRGGERGEVGARLSLGQLALRLGRVARCLGEILAPVANELGGDAVPLGGVSPNPRNCALSF